MGGRGKVKFKDSVIYKFKFWFINLAVNPYYLKTCTVFFHLLKMPTVLLLTWFILPACAKPRFCCSQGACLCTCQGRVWKVVQDKESDWQSKTVHAATFKCLERPFFHVLTYSFNSKSLVFYIKQFSGTKIKELKFVVKAWHSSAEAPHSEAYWKVDSLRDFPLNSCCKRWTTLSKIKWSGNTKELSLDFYFFLISVPAWMWPWATCFSWPCLSWGDSISRGAWQPQLLCNSGHFNKIYTPFMLGQWTK